MAKVVTDVVKDTIKSKKVETPENLKFKYLLVSFNLTLKPWFTSITPHSHKK